MIFYKTSSFGNDFIEIDQGELASPQGRRPRGGLPAGASLGALARQICDRQRGVGADGVVYYRPQRRKTQFAVFNRDGGEAELSGNGMAGLAAVLLQRRLGVSPLTLHAAIGSRQVELLGRDGSVFQLAVEIGIPDFANREFFPFLKGTIGPATIDGLEFHPVSVGNPHAVVICREMPDGEQLASLGKKIEGHAMFPKRVNVEFVQFRGADDPPQGTAASRPAGCRVYFYERGVGPTLASSTGSAAVFAVLRRLGLVGDRLLIDLEPACAAEVPAVKEAGGHRAGHPAGAVGEQIALSWRDGIFIHNFTRLICRGEYFL
jgi:diaminopimelate epimerase